MKFLLSTTTFVAFATGALAADLPLRSPAAPPLPAPAFLSHDGAAFSGFYVGVAAGWDRTLNGATINGMRYTPPAGRQGPDSDFAPSISANTIAFSPGGGLGIADAWGGAIYLGQNMRLGSFVLGAELDAHTTLNQSRSGSGGLLTGALTYTNDADAGETGDTASGAVNFRATLASRMLWDGSLRARAGYLATPELLVYAAGGLAVAQVERKLTFGGAANFAFDTGAAQATQTASGGYSKTSFATGWTIGGGVDYQFLQNWTVRIEYRYTDFGTKRIASSAVATCTPADLGTCEGIGPGTVASSVKLRENMHGVRVGLAYEFGESSIPRAIYSRF